MRVPGCAVAILVAALVLAASPLPAGCEAEPVREPPPRRAPAVFSSSEASGVLITRVYANSARDDEFVELGNPTPAAIDLAGWSVSDRETIATFPLDAILPPGGRIVVTRNATSYAEDVLAPADFTFAIGDARRMEGGVPRFADAGDEVLLADPLGNLADVYAWGDSSYAGPGWSGPPAEKMGRGEVASRLTDAGGAWIDRDLAADWDGLRRYRLGQSTFMSAPMEIRGSATAVLSPDAADVPLLSFLGSARGSIEVAVYTLESERIAAVLTDAALAGVRVRLLLEGSPVGGVEPEERRVVGGLLDAGAEVRWLGTADDVVTRYRYLHAKYAVVDRRAAWIGSENFGTSGFPPDGGAGNRGWSVVVEDPAVAAAVAAVFDADFDVRRRDSIPALEERSRLPAPPPFPPWPVSLETPVHLAQVVIGPDTALDPDGLLGLIGQARERLWIEAFYLEETWRDTPNPFLAAAFDASRRGVMVRILLDGSWTSIGPDSAGNDEVVERVNRRAREEGLDLEARLLDPSGRIDRLHNKGVVVDGRTVLISSLNWALGSATENREIGLILEDPQVASTFAAAFAADWDGRATSGADPFQVDDPRILVALYAFVGVASAVSLWKLRVGGEGIKPRARVRTRARGGAPLRGRRGEVRVLPPELVAQPRSRPGGRSGARGGGAAARGGLRGPERD